MDVIDYLLWLFTILLFGRVIGQLIVYFFAPKFLPPMEHWQSGLVYYPLLVAVQAVVLTLMVWISIDFSRGTGFWMQPHPHIGAAAYYWSYLYAGAMVVRYAMPRARRTIPIIFHCVVAAFQWVFGAYHVGVI